MGGEFQGRHRLRLRALDYGISVTKTSISRTQDYHRSEVPINFAMMGASVEKAIAEVQQTGTAGGVRFTVPATCRLRRWNAVETAANKRCGCNSSRDRPERPWSGTLHVIASRYT